MLKHLLAAALLLTFSAGSTLAALHIVNQNGMAFEPRNLTVTQGDVVRWVWSSDAHTVTNGLGASAPGAGRIFDGQLNAVAPTFQFTFNNLGNFPYFCRIHELMDMKGQITVEAVVASRPSSFGMVKALYERN